MKKLYASLLVMLTTAIFTQQTLARPVPRGDYYDYELSDYLDLEAVVNVFARSGNLVDFEHRLNDHRNAVSNLDLNGDGYVDYLRVVKLTDRRAHIILIQAVLGRDFYQDVATIVVGRDRNNREYVQVIGDPGLYGYDYIIEPVFARRPTILRWLWNSSPDRYVSRYYWGYYPSYFRFRPIVAVHVYHHHIYTFRDPRLQFRFHTHRIHPLPIELLRPYHRNDYWRNNHHLRFEYRHQNIRNRTQLPPRTSTPNPPARQPETRPSENERRDTRPATPQGGQPRVTPPANNRGGQEVERQRPQPQRAEPQRSEPGRSAPQRVEPPRSTPQRTEPQRVEPQRTTPQRTETQSTTPQRTETQRSTPQRTETQSSTPQRVQTPRNESTQPARSTQESTPSRNTQQSRERNDNSENSTGRGSTPASPRR